MASDSSAVMILDEINRLSVAYDKAKEYLQKIALSIDQQCDAWQQRHDTIVSQLTHINSLSTSCEFLLPKAQRINELTLEAVQALCRVDVLLEQIIRIDPKLSIPSTATEASKTQLSPELAHHLAPSITSQHQSFSSHRTTNGPPMPSVPVIRIPQQTLPGHLSAPNIEEKRVFKPVTYDASPNNSDDNRRPSSTLSLNNNQHSTNKGRSNLNPVPSSFNANVLRPDHMVSPYAPSVTNQRTLYLTEQRSSQEKVKIKLRRIPPGTKWKTAKIEIIDSLSGFYVENLDPKVLKEFSNMQSRLNAFYDEFESSAGLMPLENIAIGDFGVAKYTDDNRWYRARVVSYDSPNQIKIVFVDFGNIEGKFTHEFFPLDESFTDLPAQAIACSLSEAFPRTPNMTHEIWPQEAIEIFRKEVENKPVEVHFANQEDGTEQWPLHFVRIVVGNQSVTNSLNLQQQIDPRPNRYIAEQMASCLKHEEYILFNVPIDPDDFEE